MAEKLTAKQEKVLLELLKTPRIEDAARAAGVSPATVFRMLQSERFQREWRRARIETRQQTISLLVQSGALAVQVLTNIAANPAAPSTARVAAAKGLLEHSERSTRDEDLEARIEELEWKLKMGAL